MKSLLREWPAVRRRLPGRDKLLLGLDFDGTLSPIVRRPGGAVLPPHTRGLLRRLAGPRGCFVALISGRRLRDLQAKAQLPGVLYAGNHGLEMEGHGLRWTHPKALRAAKTLRTVSAELRAALKDHPRAELEDKKLTVSIHYRRAPLSQAPAIERLVRGAVRGRRGFELVKGKRVLEIRPDVRWAKGDALLRAQRLSRRPFPVFVGDDTVDEDAFRAANREGGLSVRVGRAPRSCARYRLARQDLVPRFLRLLLDHFEEGRP